MTQPSPPCALLLVVVGCTVWIVCLFGCFLYCMLRTCICISHLLNCSPCYYTVCVQLSELQCRNKVNLKRAIDNKHAGILNSQLWAHRFNSDRETAQPLSLLSTLLL